MKLFHPGTLGTLVIPLGLSAALLATLLAHAQPAIDRTVTPDQRATARQVAAQGVPLSALAPDAPDQYTVRRGDTLWGIAAKFLKSPWLWPELWGMNLRDIHNPHLIYPGQQLDLERLGERAMLRARGSADGEPGPTVRVSPRTRVDMLGAGPLPTLEPQLIEPFLAEPLVVDDDTFQRAPRIVAQANQDRVLMAKGDRVYARGSDGALLLLEQGQPRNFRVFRTATPLKDPVSGEILGYEGKYVGQAELVRGETPAGSSGLASGEPALPVPATLDVISSKEEIQVGDRLIPEPPRSFRSYMPHAPDMPVDARVVLVHGDAARYGAQNNIIVINKGRRDGIENGHVLSLLSTGPQVIDKTDGNARIRLPDERNGLALVFRPFERVSYALVVQSVREVQVGDKLGNPR